MDGPKFEIAYYIIYYLLSCPVPHGHDWHWVAACWTQDGGWHLVMAILAHKVAFCAVVNVAHGYGQAHRALVDFLQVPERRRGRIYVPHFDSQIDRSDLLHLCWEKTEKEIVQLSPGLPEVQKKPCHDAVIKKWHSHFISCAKCKQK